MPGPGGERERGDGRWSETPNQPIYDTIINNDNNDMRWEREMGGWGRIIKLHNITLY